jgi:hypothetical protein
MCCGFSIFYEWLQAAKFFHYEFFKCKGNTIFCDINEYITLI